MYIFSIYYKQLSYLMFIIFLNHKILKMLYHILTIYKGYEFLIHPRIRINSIYTGLLCELNKVT